MTEEKTPTTYAEWLKKSFWSWLEAVRLLACPPCSDVKYCYQAWLYAQTDPPVRIVERVEYETERDALWDKGTIKKYCINEPETEEGKEKRKFCKRQCVKNLDAHKFVELINNDIEIQLYPGYQVRVAKPLAVIEWALHQTEVTVPQPLLDWYKEQKAAIAAAMSFPAVPKAPPGETASILSAGQEETFSEKKPRKIRVNVPPVLWAGKPHKAVYSSLEREYDPPVIAYVLMIKIGGITKTDAGRLFYQEDKGLHEAKTYQRKTDKLLKEAEKYSITFD